MQNLKPFDFVRWRAGDPVQFRNGQNRLNIFFSEIRFDLKQPAVFISIDANGYQRHHDINGKLFPYDNGNGFDIVMAPKKVIYYFASWLHEPGERMFIAPKPSESEIDQVIEHWIKTGVQGVMKHEIAIEE